MALILGELSDALTDLFEGSSGYPEDETEAGQRWADTYREYAGSALAGPTSPLSSALTLAGNTLAGTLAGAFAAAKAGGGIPALTLALDSAFVAFWFSPPMAFEQGTTMAGVVTVAPPGVLSGGLTAAFAAGLAPASDAPAQATLIAGVLDAWTRTVMVVNTPLSPPGPPLPPVPLV